MSITRRRALALAGATLAAPFVLRIQRAQAAATLTRLGDPIFLGEGQPGSQFGVALAAFPNPAHGFIAGWINRQPSGRVNFIQYFRADGTPLSAPIQMKGPPGTTDGAFANGVFPIARPDGSALILFSAKNENEDEEDAVDIFAQRMSAARTKIGNPSLVNTLTKLDQSNPLGVLLSTGNFLALWVSFLQNLDTIDARSRIITFGGLGVTSDRRINPDVAGEQKPRSAAALAGGRSVVSYSSLVGDNWFLRAIVLNADGKPARAPFALRKAPASLKLGSAAVLARANQDKWIAIGKKLAPGTSKAALFLQEFDLITRSGQSRTIGPAFTYDEGIDDEFSTPNLCFAGPNLVFVQHLGLVNGRSSVLGLVVDVATKHVKAPRVVIHYNNTVDTVPDALIGLPQQTYVSGFSDGQGADVTTAKAALQRMKLTLS